LRFSPEAFANLDAIAAYIRTRGSIESAERWFNSIIEAIRSLNELPARCPVSDLAADLAAEVRILLHGNRNRRYKIYFLIDHEFQSVRVFHVRHWAMKPIESDELGDLMDEFDLL
jgi:plasmid stabilization system protein ParE